MNNNTNIPFHLSDIQTFQYLHAAISEKRDSHHAVITLLGSANTQPFQIQRIVPEYLEQLEPYVNKTIFMLGGRGDQGSVMNTCVTECHQRKFYTFVVGIEPVFDLGEKIPPERVFAFKNISLRCYALTQLSDILIVFPGGLGTIQEIIVPLMHRKLDTPMPHALQGPRSIFIATDLSNPVTEFLTILPDRQFVSGGKSIPLISVTVSNFYEMFSNSLFI